MCKICGRPAIYKTAQLCAAHYMAAYRAKESQYEYDKRITSSRIASRVRRGKTAETTRPYGIARTDMLEKRKEQLRKAKAKQLAKETHEQKEARLAKQRDYAREQRAKNKL